MARTAAAAFALAGVAALAFAGAGKGGVAGIFVAMVFLLLAATLLSKATRIATSLRELVGKRVVITAWGAPLAPESSELVLSSVTSFGAGLLIRLNRGQGAELLKVAQPENATFENGRWVVPQAAYVQWAGRRLSRLPEQHALVLAEAPRGLAGERSAPERATLGSLME